MNENSKALLRMLAKEMRESAGSSHGNPAAVRITAETLCDYADALEMIANDPDQTGDPRLA